MKAAAALLAALALGGATKAPREDPFAGRTATATATCIDAADRQNVRIVDERTIAYYSVARRLWRNDLPERCRGLGDDPILVVEQFGGQLCANDRIRLIDRGSRIPGPYCRLGRFTAWDRPVRARTD